MSDVCTYDAVGAHGSLNVWRCSNCGFQKASYNEIGWLYCPECGAKILRWRE